jgi:hypothetical protein
MKKVIFLSLVIALLISSCTQKEVKSSYEGAWKVVSWIAMEGDSLTWRFPGDYSGNEISINAKNHFLWAGRYKKDTTFVDNWGGGTYTRDGNRLEHTFLYCVDKSMVGTKRRLLWELKNDTASYTWPCDENWQVNKDKYYVQKLVKAE